VSDSSGQVTPRQPFAAEKVSFVLTNYNGLENLQFCLSGVVAAAKNRNLADEILVVDDCSTDGSVSFLAREHPEVRLLELKQRSGFLGAANAGFKAAKNRHVALLSNDMIPEPDFLDSLVPHFEDPDVFAVSATLLDPKGRIEGGRRVGVFLLGTFFLLDSAKDYRPFPARVRPHGTGAAPSLFTGANALFDREKFLTLGGFDPLFYPFYWEDADLCYRAWKHGYKILWEPSSQVTHHQRLGTIKKTFDRSTILTVRKRNRLLFAWKNLTTPGFIAQHCAILVVQLLFSWMVGNFRFYPCFFQALGRIKEVVRLRKSSHTATDRTDRQILELVNSEE